MSKHATSLRGVAVVAISAASLSLPLMSIAQAGAGTPKQHHHYRAAHKELSNSTPYAMQPELYNSARNPHMIRQEVHPWTPRMERPFPDYPFHGYNGG
ncbi:MAG TPA: hypothetical protein VK281_12415 [Xanthobacteraceae bacterium]|nr:hypothetical protein [Xanthobacteraceae bacterium]